MDFGKYQAFIEATPFFGLAVTHGDKPSPFATRIIEAVIVAAISAGLSAFGSTYLIGQLNKAELRALEIRLVDQVSSIDKRISETSQAMNARMDRQSFKLENITAGQLQHLADHANKNK